MPVRPSRLTAVALTLLALLVLGAGVGLGILDGQRETSSGARVALEALVVAGCAGSLMLLALRSSQRRRR